MDCVRFPILNCLQMEYFDARMPDCMAHACMKAHVCVYIALRLDISRVNLTLDLNCEFLFELLAE